MARTVVENMKSFSESIPRTNKQFKFLPLFHTCDGVDARRYMSEGKIDTLIDCEVFGEKITYLFYGRAAYKYDVTDEGTTRLDLYPVCFVFEFDLVKDIKRIYPFDSGAKHHNLLDKYINPKISLTNFEIEPDTRRIADIIVRFYRSNGNYLDGKTREIDVDPLDFETSAYIEMNRGYLAGRADERRATVEVQTGQSVPFQGGALKGVVCPIQYLDSALFQTFAGKSGITVKTYQIDVWNPRIAFGALSGAAKQFLDPEAMDAP
jgi:hypothetical protein